MGWDYAYSNEAVMRFNEAAPGEQLAILEQWYPVGMTCKRLNRSSLRSIAVGKKATLKSYDELNEYEIAGYSLSGNIYSIVAKQRVYGEYMTETKIHPAFLAPTENWKRRADRDDKLNGLLGE